MIENKIKNLVRIVGKRIKNSLIIGSLGVSLNINYLGCGGEENCPVQHESKLYSLCELHTDCGCLSIWKEGEDEVPLNCYQVAKTDGKLVNICTLLCGDYYSTKEKCWAKGGRSSISIISDSICAPEGVCVPKNWYHDL